MRIVLAATPGPDTHHSWQGGLPQHEVQGFMRGTSSSNAAPPSRCRVSSAIKRERTPSQVNPPETGVLLNEPDVAPPASGGGPGLALGAPGVGLRQSCRLIQRKKSFACVCEVNAGPWLKGAPVLSRTPASCLDGTFQSSAVRLALLDLVTAALASKNQL